MTDRQAMVVSEPTAEDQHVQATNYFNAEQMYQAYLAQDPVRVAANDAFDQAMARTTFDTPMQAANVVPIKQPQEQMGFWQTLKLLNAAALHVEAHYAKVAAEYAWMLVKAPVQLIKGIGDAQAGADMMRAYNKGLTHDSAIWNAGHQRVTQSGPELLEGVVGTAALAIPVGKVISPAVKLFAPVAEKLGGSALVARASDWGLFGKGGKNIQTLTVEETNVANLGHYRPTAKLPRNQHGEPIPYSERPHSQIGTAKSRKAGDYTQAREWGYDESGQLVHTKTIDFTDHGRPQNHPNPHQHRITPNTTGGTPRKASAEPLTIDVIISNLEQQSPGGW